MDTRHLVVMVNQIADFFAGQIGGAEEAIAEHVAKNWDPRMRAAILAHVEAGGDGLTPPARAALESLKTSTGTRSE